jgi:teichoic acid transport system permease protein
MPESGLSGAKLAEQHGLTVAGARPGIVTYTRQLFAYRHFITTYSSAGITASFQKARLGRLWQVLTPLANAGVYYLIFGVIIGTNRGIPNFIAYLCTGIFVFGFSSQVALQGVQSITKNLTMIRALHFPRASMPLATTYTQFLNLIAAMVVLVAIVLITGEPVTLRWLLVIPALLLQSVFNMGLGLALARVGSKVTDLKQLLPFVIRTWMYTSGVLYSVDKFDKALPGWAAAIAKSNPLVVYIDLVRYGLLHHQTLVFTQWHEWALGGAWAVVSLVVGYIYFWRGEAEYGRG